MRLIDADALKETIKQDYVFYGFTDLLKDFFNCIDEQPTIDPERKKGKWIDVDPYGDSGLAFKCSECREINLREANYCPNCGCEMER